MNKLKVEHSHVRAVDLHLTKPQRYNWKNGKFLWPSIAHSPATRKKMEVSTFCFLKQVLLVLVFVLKFTWLEN